MDSLVKFVCKHDGIAAFGAALFGGASTMAADKAYDAGSPAAFVLALLLFTGAIAIPVILGRRTALGHTHRDSVEATRILLKALARAFGHDEGRCCRTNIMLVNEGRTRRKVHAATAFNMDADGDRDFEMDMNSGVSGVALMEGKAAAAQITRPAPGASGSGIPGADWAKVRPRLRSILSAPIRDPESPTEPLGTIQVDSDADLENTGFDKPSAWAIIEGFADLSGYLVKGLKS